MGKRIALATIAVWMTAAAPAWGHMLPHAKQPARMSPQQEYAYGAGTARHATRAEVRWSRTVAWFRAHSQVFEASDPYRQFVAHSAYRHARAELRGHRWLARYGRRVRAEGWRRMHPAPLIAHRAGWLCIHSREGSWSDTGDPYWGGLQMHPGWGGVHHASDLSPDAQMALAEGELRKNRYSHAWLAGQWPLTYPPCAGLF